MFQNLILLVYAVACAKGNLQVIWCLPACLLSDFLILLILDAFLSFFFFKKLHITIAYTFRTPCLMIK